jgi:predicted Zn-dependent peptidase
MALLTERLPHFRGASLGIWVPAGSRHEVSGEEGYSHFLEHMIFKGTKSRTAAQIAREVDRAGGEFNAFTTREYTCFHIGLLAGDMDLAVDILADVLLHSKLSDEDIERERNVVLQEMDMVADNPEEVLFDTFFEKSLGRHPLGRPILGTPKVIKSVNNKRLKPYFERHYAPSRMIVTAAGDVEHGHLVRRLNHALGGFRGANPRAGAGAKRKAVFQPGGIILKRDVEQAQVVLGFPALPINHKLRYALSILNLHLGGGMSSRLFQQIREERGLAYSTYSTVSSFSDCGVEMAYIGCAAKDALEATALVGKETRRLQERKLTATELKELKQSVTNTILINEDSVDGHMMHLARAEMFFGQEIKLNDVFRGIRAVTAEQVQAMAKNVFRSDRLYAAAVVPHDEKGITAARLKNAWLKGTKA